MADIDDVAAEPGSLAVPEGASIAHGRMSESRLESIVDFWSAVLTCWCVRTIVETGLDTRTRTLHCHTTPSTTV